MRGLKLLVVVALLVLMSASLAFTYSWTKYYTVRVSVCPGISKGAYAWVTFYGNNGYYRHVMTDSYWGTTHTVTLAGVPGGSGVYNRIDVDLADGTHREYYGNRIYSLVSDKVSLTFWP